jgi:hypothetical protein
VGDVADRGDAGRLRTDEGQAASPGTVESLVLDLLEWIGPGARPYDEVLEAWRTSCPRLPVWEEAKARGYVTEGTASGRGRMVSVSDAGAAYLSRHRGPRQAAP